MKYDLVSDQLIEFNDSDILTLLNFGKEKYPSLLPVHGEYARENMKSFKLAINNLAYLFFKEKLKAI